MIVVDTTVWVDFFRGADEPHVAELVALIEQDAGVALTDVILTEVLQGLRGPAGPACRAALESLRHPAA